MNYQDKLAGALHKWLGENNPWHDSLSLYAFSQLRAPGSRVLNGKLAFPDGAHWFVSMHDAEQAKALISGMQASPEVAWGMRVEEVQVEVRPSLEGGEAVFRAASPVFIKRQVGDRDVFYLYDHPEASALLTETMRHKMEVAGLPPDPSLHVSFDAGYAKPKSKLVHYGNMKLRASQCPVRIKGRPDTLAFARDVGAGNSTGIGFGALE
jgi:CRISPR-associated endoribonuclease Cas6